MKSLETFNLNGNDIGLGLNSMGNFSTQESANTLNNLLTHFSNLKELYMSDCKLNLSDSAEGHNDVVESSWIKFFNTLKSNNSTKR